MGEPQDLTSILAVLLEERVDLILVGALAAVAQGAPITTHDVEVVHARTPENVARLVTALSRLNAHYRGRPASSPLPPDPIALAGPGHSLFVTDLGPLDCLGVIEGGMSYDDLLPLSLQIELDGRALRVLGLETIVRLKRASTASKDRLVVPILEETLRKSRA
jgi:hypothetical protein